MSSNEDILNQIKSIRDESKTIFDKIKKLSVEREEILTQLNEERVSYLTTLNEIYSCSNTSFTSWKEFLVSMNIIEGYNVSERTIDLCNIKQPEEENKDEEIKLEEAEESEKSEEIKEEIKEEIEKDKDNKKDETDKEENDDKSEPENESTKSSTDKDDNESKDEDIDNTSEDKDINESDKPIPKKQPPPPPGKPSHIKEEPTINENKPEPPSSRPAPPVSRPAPPGSRPAPPGSRAAPPGGSRFGAARTFENPVLNMSDKDLKEFDINFDEKLYLTEILISKNTITTLPDNIKVLSKLTKLDIGHNRFEEIPECLFELKDSLKELLIPGNRFKLDSFGDKWENMEHLIKIDLENNIMGDIPENILKTPNLEYLNLNRNELKSISLSICSLLKNIKFLGLRWNHLTEIPNEIGELHSLEELVLSDNNLLSFPETIEELQNLQKLYLANNELTTLPSSIGKLQNLLKLHVQHNKLEELPKELFIEENFALEELLLQHNKLKSIPIELWKIDSLITLNLMANEIDILPSDVKHLVVLQTLNMASNKISIIPEEIGELIQLQELNLGFNLISQVPESINKLESLERLYLGYNKISIIPEIDNLQELWEFFITGNTEITELPKSLWTLPNMNKIYASNMKLTEIPNDITNLQELELLDFGFNQIKEIPEDISELQILRRINVTHNQISKLPALSNCYDMQNVDLSYNEFTEIPIDDFEMLLERDVELLFDGNPASDKCEGHIKDEVIHIHHSKRFPIVGIADMIGKRPSMEDAMAVQGSLNNDENTDFYGLYDGHAGQEAASWCGKYVHKVMLEHIEKGEEELESLINSYPEVNQSFKDYLYSDNFTGQSKYCGTTAVSVYIKGNDIYVVNVGDSRAVICRNGEPLRLSYDHKPYEDVEQNRIRSLGGSVIGETGRVNGLLAVSRSIGDFYMHPFVVDTPFSKKYELTDDDEFLVIACDGVWDEVFDDVAISLIRDEKNPFIASCMLRDYAYILGSDDNISVMIIHLK